MEGLAEIAGDGDLRLTDRFSDACDLYRETEKDERQCAHESMPVVVN